jgi:hypothetical protein
VDARRQFQNHEATKNEVLMGLSVITDEIPPGFKGCLAERSHGVGDALLSKKELPQQADRGNCARLWAMLVSVQPLQFGVRTICGLGRKVNIFPA